MLFLSEEQVRQVLTYEDLIPAMRRALMDFSAGVVVQPPRAVLSVDRSNGWFGVMPAVYGPVMGAKLVTFYPRNAEVGKPTHMAVIQLFRSDTGEPLAMLDGRLITEMRTAAVSAVATDLLAAKDASVLAILGSGVQARSHVKALSLVRSFREVRVWSRTMEHAEEFATKTGARVTSREEAARGADVVLTATSSSLPVLSGKWLKPTALVIGIGAVTPDRRELDDDVMRGPIVVESREAAQREPGDILIARAQVTAELGELLNGARIEPSDFSTVYKSVGIAVEDLAAAKLVYDQFSK